jgi:hypothetical protein
MEKYSKPMETESIAGVAILMSDKSDFKPKLEEKEEVTSY